MSIKFLHTSGQLRKEFVKYIYRKSLKSSYKLPDQMASEFWIETLISRYHKYITHGFI